MSPTGDLSLLRDVHANHLVYARGELVAIFAGENLHIHDDAEFAVRHAQRSIAHLARLIAEDRAQQALFRRQLGFALRRDLADQNIVCAHLRADADDAALVQIAQRVVGYCRGYRG